MFNSKAQLAAALGLELVPAEGLRGMTDGSWVADTGDGFRGLAQAMLVRARVDHDHEIVTRLSGALRALVSKE